ncbi:MAG: hydantoinase/oxoprolinase family protein [Deltaproteobacteria bacterium]|nr:hydantoinase/oxoprolinase family protein [Deltaproteobacteria bacterium]
MSRVAIDVGGTFTDCLVLGDQGQLGDFKALTTPEDPSRGLMDCLEKAARAERKSVREFVAGLECIIHGTTLATNALLTEKGAKVAMLTTEGFRDAVEIRRGFKNIRTSMYNVVVPPYKPLVPRYLRLPIRERTLFTGEIETPADRATAEAAIEKCKAEDVRSIAVCFLHSYANPENERQVAEICRATFDGRVYVTASHEVLPNWGEYERFSTTVVSAYIGPIVSEYLLALEKQLADEGLKGGLLIVRSDALVQSAAHSRRQAVTLINSGPAAAPTGALFWGRSSGHNDLISIDMGGTSLDVCLIRKGEIPTTTESWVGDERVATKMVDIHSIGAGGGSLAWIDSLGLLRVGPQSAGAMPGPACYGRGGDKPTVTDADVVLGYIPTDYFLGGEIVLDEERARKAIRTVTEPLRMTEIQAAQTVFQTVNSLMADQVIELSTKRGLDLRDFSLAVGGGAGPVHGACVAELLEIPTVIIPKYAALYSAFGMFAMDMGREYSRSYIVRTDKLDLERIETLYEELAQQAIADFKETHTEASGILFNRTADMRYAGQFHLIEIPLPNKFKSPADVEAVVKAFHARHKELYTFDLPQRGTDFLTFRLKATAARKSDLRIVPVPQGSKDPRGALKRTRRCFFGNEWVETPCYQGDRLLAGNVISGPAIIEEKATTVVIPNRFTCTVDAGGTYALRRS